MTGRQSILQLVDSLELAGTESVAVNLANEFARRGLDSHLCATRHGGKLVDYIDPAVTYSCLNRAHRFDTNALLQLRSYVRKNNIQIVHAHSTSLFIGIVGSLGFNRPKVIWHDHYGKVEKRNAIPYRIASYFLSAVITVSQQSFSWVKQNLLLDENNIHFIPNFAVEREEAHSIKLPGISGKRIVCVAGFRPQKDQLTLVKAMKHVYETDPTIHLIFVGGGTDPDYLRQVQDRVRYYDLDDNIHFLGERKDISSILHAADAGVLSSKSEGLPLALLEYAFAKLPVVCTSVGHCPQVLEDGQAGLLVPPNNPVALGNAILEVFGNQERRKFFGEKLFRHVGLHYSATAVTTQIIDLYESILRRQDHDTETNITAVRK